MVLLLTDLKGFLEKVTVELEEVFNNTCAFPKINQLLMQYVGEMTAEIERMRGNAWLLCTSQQKTTLQRATTIPNSKKRLMNSCKCTMYLMPITLPSQPFKPCNLSMEESYIFFLSGKSFATYRILLSMCPPPKKCSPLDCEGSVVWGSSV